MDRALGVMSAFQSGDKSLSLAQLAERTGLYKSTLLRLLASLGHAAWVHRLDDGRYALGPEIARLHGIYATSFSLDHVVMPVLRDLVAQTGESAAYHVRQNVRLNGNTAWQRLCLYRVDSPNLLRDHVKAGDILPADRGAGARILIAFGETSAATSASVPPKDRKLMATIRAQGYCALVGDRTAELAGISAPVFQADGTLAAALTLTMPAHRYREAHVKPVLEAARLLGQRVG